MVALRPRLILVAAALAAFGLSLAGPFHFDDYLLLNDAVLAAHSGWWEVFRAVQTRPLTWFTFWLNRQVSTAPFLWHLFNLLLHLAAVLLAWRVLRRMLPESAAFAGALLFAVHPIQAQAVAYIYARAIVLAALLTLVSLDRWLDGKRWQAVLWFAVALLAKEEVVAFPVFLMVLSVGGSWRKQWKPLAAMLLLSLAAGLRVIWATTVLAGTHAATGAGISPVAYFETQGLVVWHYARLLVFPFGFSVDPDIARAGAAGWLGWLAAAAALAALIGFRPTRNIGLWLLGALVLLLPSTSIFPVPDLAADRRLYLPMLAVGAAAGLALQQFRAPRWLVPALAVILVGLSVHQMTFWRTEHSLWAEAERQAPRKVRPRIQLARTLPPSEAAPLLEETKALAPQDPSIAAELGKVYLSLGQPERALPEFGRALALEPGSAQALNNRGAALLALGQRDAAAADFHRALEKDPCLVSAIHNLRRLGEKVELPPRCRLTPEQRRFLDAFPAR